MADRVYTTEYLNYIRFNQELTAPVYNKLRDHMNSIKRNEVVSPVQYMMKALENSEKDKNDHNAQVANQLEELLNAKDLTREQRRAMLMAVDERKLVVEPAVLDPVLGAYEKINNALKIENNSLRKDITNLSDSVNLLLSDNQKLREFLDKKNTDLFGVLETVSENEGELIQSLNANLALLTDENKGLLYENTMLKDLRLKDKARIDEADNLLLQEKRVQRKQADDLSDANLRKQSLESQIKIYEAKLKNLMGDLDDERRKREAAEKRILSLQAELVSTTGSAGTGNSLSTGGKPGQEISVPWTQKANAIKNQEKLEQENVFLLNEKTDIQQRLTTLEDELRKRDLEIRAEKTKFADQENIIQGLKTESQSLMDTNNMLKKKISALMNGDVAGPGTGSLGMTADPKATSHGVPNSSMKTGSVGDPVMMLGIVEQENDRLKKLLEEKVRTCKLQFDQFDSMNKDLLDNLTKENRDLKADKRNLMAKVKQLMEKKPSPEQVAALLATPNSTQGQFYQGGQQGTQSQFYQGQDTQGGFYPGGQQGSPQGGIYQGPRQSYQNGNGGPEDLNQMMAMVQHFTHTQLIGNPAFDKLVEENEALKKQVGKLEKENIELQQKVSEFANRLGVTGVENHEQGFFGEFADNMSEPTPRRDVNGGFFRSSHVGARRDRTNFEREPSPIDDLVGKINSKQASRGNSPHIIERYFREGGRSGLECADGFIDRRKENKMFSKTPIIPPKAPAGQTTLQGASATAWGGVQTPNYQHATQGLPTNQVAGQLNAVPQGTNSQAGQGAVQAGPNYHQYLYQNVSQQVGTQGQPALSNQPQQEGAGIEPSIGSTSNIRTQPSQISRGFRADPYQPFPSDSPLTQFRRGFPGPPN